MLIAGIDEAGRGPCFGPLVIGIVVIEMKNEDQLRKIGVKDSKQLTPKQRQEQFGPVQAAAVEYATVHIPAPELDQLMDRYSLNEIEAMKIGFLLNQLKNKPEVAFIDSPDTIAGNFAKRIKKYISFPCKLTTEHKADSNYPVCAAASILAKVERDQVIEKLAEKHGPIGSGYSHDPQTIAYLSAFVEKNNSLPEFCRKKWETSQRELNKKRQSKLFSTP